eukprot:6156370-Prymnesium_polylepis.1
MRRAPHPDAPPCSMVAPAGDPQRPEQLSRRGAERGPRAVTESHTLSIWLVHDDLAHCKELLGREGLREEIRRVVR